MARPASMYGKTGERTPEHNALLTAKMRENKNQLRFRAAVTAQAAQLENPSLWQPRYLRALVVC